MEIMSEYSLFFHLCCAYQDKLNYLECLQNRYDTFAENHRLSEQKALAKAIVIASKEYGSISGMLDYYNTLKYAYAGAIARSLAYYVDLYNIK